MTDEVKWRLPEAPEVPEKPKTIRIVVANPRPTVPYTLRPCESLVWDVVSRGTREYIDIIPGQFLGLPVDVLADCLSNMAGLHLLSAEGITPARRSSEWGQDIQRMGKVRQVQDAAAKRAKDAAQKQADKEPAHEPWGLPTQLENLQAQGHAKRMRE